MLPATYEPLVAPARARNQLWRTIGGGFAIVLIYMLLMFGLGAALAVMQGLDGLERTLRSLDGGNNPWGVIILLMTFAGGWLGVWAIIHLVHRRSVGSLMGRAPRVLRDFVLGVAVMLGISALGAAVGLLVLPPLELAMDPRVWLMFLPLAMLGLLVQTGAEELFFRGYLQSQLAARFAHPLIWMILPSALFGLAHLSPDAPSGMVWLIVAATGLFGLVAADLTARTGSLGLAWGLHFANNFLAILMVSVMGGLDGLALFRLSEDASATLVPLILGDMALMVVVWGLCRLHLRRR